MSLQNKFLIIFGLLFISFAIMQFAINQIFILPSFIHLENDEAIQNLSRVNESIRNEIRRLDDVCHNWSAWDDTYEFMENGSQEYIESNLTIESFRTSDLNLICFLKTNGEIFFGKMYDSSREKKIQLEAFSTENSSWIYTDIISGFNSFGSIENAYKRGILLTEKGPIMLAARPIITSGNSGPSHGTFIMGRFMTESIVNKLKKETKVDFNLHLCNDNLPFKLKEIMNNINSSSVHILKETSDNIFMYDSFPSIRRSPAFLTEIIFPREITKQGIKAIRYSLIFLILSGFIIMLVIFVLIKTIIIKPIVNMSRHVKRIEAGSYDLRLDMTRKDAIGELANSFDKMIAKIELQTDQLEKLSSIDGLTGMFNRRIFDETLESEWKRMIRGKKYLSVIMCDVDFFKLFNDNYGHQEGDKCLRSIADAIKETLKRPSDFAARYGGEEFVVLLSDTSPEGAHHVAEKIREKIHNLKIRHDKSQIYKYVTLSLGISSVIPCKELCPMKLVKTADQALYKSKKKGRNTVLFKPIYEK